MSVNTIKICGCQLSLRIKYIFTQTLLQTALLTIEKAFQPLQTIWSVPVYVLIGWMYTIHKVKTLVTVTALATIGASDRQSVPKRMCASRPNINAVKQLEVAKQLLGRRLSSVLNPIWKFLYLKGSFLQLRAKGLDKGYMITTWYIKTRKRSWKRKERKASWANSKADQLSTRSPSVFSIWGSSCNNSRWQRVVTTIAGSQPSQTRQKDTNIYLISYIIMNIVITARSL